MSEARPDLRFGHGFSTSKGYPEPFDEATGFPALSTSTDRSANPSAALGGCRRSN
jgi:hypothetical protein